MIGYYAKVEYDKDDKIFNVEFPNIQGCYTYGKTFEEALIYAEECLTGYLSSIIENNFDIPIQNIDNTDGLHFIKPKINISFVIWLKKMRKEKGYTQKQIADILHISYQAYQKYENPRTANPTLKKIDEIQNIFGNNLISV